MLQQQGSQADRPGFAAACAGRDGRGRGPARGAALPCPARAAAQRAAAEGRDAADHDPKPGPGCCSSVQQLRAAPLRAGAAALPLPLRSPWPLAAAGLPGPVMRITGVIRVRHSRTAIAAQLRITEAALCAELGPGAVLLSVSFRSSRPLPAAAALPLQCRSAWSAGSAASSREPVQPRCRGSWSEDSGGGR